MKRNKSDKKIDEKEKEAFQEHMPLFCFGYNLFVICALIALFFVLLLVVLLPDDGNGTVMLTAVLVVQLIGLIYFLPFYFFPEIYTAIKCKRLTKVNITLLMVSTLIYALFYPMFQLALSVAGK